MADVELVIKIPEEKLNIIKNKMYCGIYDADLYKAIENGIPLPKGHGRIDVADTFKKHGLIREQEPVLDKIRAEIIEHEGYCRLSDDEYPACKECTDNVFGIIYGILDKYKAGGN